MPFGIRVPISLMLGRAASIDSCAYTSVKEASSHSDMWQRARRAGLLKRGLEIRRSPRKEMVASPRASSRPRQFYDPS